MFLKLKRCFEKTYNIVVKGPKTTIENFDQSNTDSITKKFSLHDRQYSLSGPRYDEQMMMT